MSEDRPSEAQWPAAGSQGVPGQPGHAPPGAPAQGAYGQPGYAPPPPPIRPRLLWIALSWALFAVLLVVGIVGQFAGLFAAVVDAAPTRTFGSGERVTVHLDPADHPAIYVVPGGTGGTARCDIVSPSSEGWSLTEPGIAQSVVLNDTTWYLLLLIEVPAPGSYEVVCEGDAWFGIGRELVSVFAVSPLVLIGLPIVGFVIAVVTTIVVMIRRRNMYKYLIRSNPWSAPPAP